jgi:hypothetical protein
MMLLAACSPQQQKASADPAPVSVQVLAAAAPSPTATPIDCQDEQSGGYGNAKECYYATCQKGDAKACRMADSFNGNLYPVDLAEETCCGDGSSSGQDASTPEFCAPEIAADTEGRAK